MLLRPRAPFVSFRFDTARRTGRDMLGLEVRASHGLFTPLHPAQGSTSWVLMVYRRTVRVVDARAFTNYPLSLSGELLFPEWAHGRGHVRVVV